MKRFFKKFVCRILRWLSRCRLRRLNGVRVIGVTGSIGKTSVKDAIAHVLSSHFRILKSEKSYNTEFGLPLTILGIKGGQSLISWFQTLWKAFLNAFFSKENFDFLVLELGVDKPGDMDAHLSLIQPDIAVFTAVAPVHLSEGQFSDLDQVMAEKSKLPCALKNDGIAVLNIDDERISELPSRENIPGKTIFYGISSQAKLYAENIVSSLEGLSFDVVYGNIRKTFEVPVVGKHHVSILLPAICVGMQCGMYMSEIADQLRTFRLPPGRMSVIPGIRGSVIVDSSYNASPVATAATLLSFLDLSLKRAQRKIVVLGNMNELGDSAESAHREVGACIAESGADYFVTIGDYARFSAESAEKAGFDKDRIFSFSDALSGAQFLENIIQSGDFILVKGSQNKVRLERLVKHIMKEPERAEELLVRQEKPWQKIE